MLGVKAIQQKSKIILPSINLVFSWVEMTNRETVMLKYNNIKCPGL